MKLIIYWLLTFHHVLAQNLTRFCSKLRNTRVIVSVLERRILRRHRRARRLVGRNRANNQDNRTGEPHRRHDYHRWQIQQVSGTWQELTMNKTITDIFVHTFVDYSVKTLSINNILLYSYWMITSVKIFCQTTIILLKT